VSALRENQGGCVASRRVWYGQSKDARLQNFISLISDNKFVVLGGQHSSKALSMLREDFLGKQGDRGMPVALTGVKADVLHHESPISVRKLVAGEAQFAQEGVSSIPLSCFAARLLEYKVENMNYGDQLLTEHIITKAIACCGYRRPTDPVCCKNLKTRVFRIFSPFFTEFTAATVRWFQSIHLDHG
jgi:hypothetical protein